VKEPKFTPPFKTLGTRLKYLREHSSESLAEVSGAVEINEDTLDLIEKGVERPSEEILMLLINHFEMQDTEAVALWELAGYDRRNTPDILNFGMSADDIQSAKQMIMMLAVDTRTQYSDGVDIDINNAGVVMAFTQASGQNQRQVVARVGMSLSQAEAVSEILQQAIIRARYGKTKSLPSPKRANQARKTTKKDSDKQ
jgi:transcriptional regulator with XRE-family HTH domain